MQKSAYLLRICYLISYVCSSDLGRRLREAHALVGRHHSQSQHVEQRAGAGVRAALERRRAHQQVATTLHPGQQAVDVFGRQCARVAEHRRSEEHTSELQSLMRTSYAVFFLNKKHKHTMPN